MNSSQTASNRRQLAAAILTVIAGAQVVVIQPGMVQAYVDHLAMDAAAAGRTLSYEMWGFTFTTIALIWLATRWRWHLMLRFGLGLVVVANIASTIASDTGFVLVRLLAGVGAGAAVSLGFATIGRQANADRWFGIMIAGVLIYGAIALGALPTLLATGGFAGLAAWLVIIPCLALALVGFMPRQSDSTFSSPRALLGLDRSQSFALVAMLFYFVAQGAAWSYMALIGAIHGLSSDVVSGALALSQFPGIAGALFAAWAGARFGSARPLAGGIIGGIASVLILLAPQSAVSFTFAACLFNACWNMTHPYLLGVMARLDGSGIVVVRATAMQKIGLALGPLLASLAIGGGSTLAAAWIAAFAMGLSLIFIVLCLRSGSLGSDLSHSTQS